MQWKKSSVALAVGGLFSLLALGGCSSSHSTRTVTRKIPMLPAKLGLTAYEPSKTILKERVGAGNSSFTVGDVGSPELIVQVVCNGPGTITVLGNTMKPCVGFGAWTNVVPWSANPKELRVTVKASPKTAWGIYIAVKT
jgi:hypothetical protein